MSELKCKPNCIKGTPLWQLYDVRDDNQEFCLFDSVITEYTDISGFEVMYYRVKSKLDRLYGEDSNQDYYEPVKTKISYEPSEEINMIDAFGVHSDETLEYSLMPKGIFNRDVGGNVDGVPLLLSNATGGSGYVSSNDIPVEGGSGHGLCVDIKTRNGVIVNIKINNMNKGYGYTIDDVVTITSGDYNATVTITKITTAKIKPIAGDVIKTLWNNRNYEVVDIGSEQSIFMGKKLIWEFILRPFRFSEQSLKSEEIYRSKVVYNTVHIYPDGDLVDITYPDGSEMIGLPIEDVNIDITRDELECGYTYKQNSDGSYDIIDDELLIEQDYDSHPEYFETSKPVETKVVDMLGDNEWIEKESNKIDNYSDIDSLMFVVPKSYPIKYGVSTNITIDQSIIDGFDVIDGLLTEKYIIKMDIQTSYLYILVPIELHDYKFVMNGFNLDMSETERDIIIDGSQYTVKEYRTNVILNGSVTVHVIPIN